MRGHHVLRWVSVLTTFASVANTLPMGDEPVQNITTNGQTILGASEPLYPWISPMLQVELLYATPSINRRNFYTSLVYVISTLSLSDPMARPADPSGLYRHSEGLARITLSDVQPGLTNLLYMQALYLVLSRVRAAGRGGECARYIIYYSGLIAGQGTIFPNPNLLLGAAKPSTNTTNGNSVITSRSDFIGKRASDPLTMSYRLSLPLGFVESEDLSYAIASAIVAFAPAFYQQRTITDPVTVLGKQSCPVRLHVTPFGNQAMPPMTGEEALRSLWTFALAYFEKIPGGQYCMEVVRAPEGSPEGKIAEFCLN